MQARPRSWRRQSNVPSPQRDTNDGGPAAGNQREPFQHGFMALPAGFADKTAELHG
jgi:hypothetical protein